MVGSLALSDFDDAPGEWETIECVTVGRPSCRWLGWLGCLIAFGDENVCVFFSGI